MNNIPYSHHKKDLNKSKNKFAISETDNKKISIKQSTTAANKNQPIICVGGANIDRKLYVKNEMKQGTSNPANSSTTIGGVVIANPVPKEHSMDADFINGIIANAIKEAEELNIAGKDTTPFLLAKIKELTNGKSLDVNIELVKHNAKVGSQIAVSYNNQTK